MDSSKYQYTTPIKKSSQPSPLNREDPYFSIIDTIDKKELDDLLDEAFDTKSELKTASKTETKESLQSSPYTIIKESSVTTFKKQRKTNCVISFQMISHNKLLISFSQRPNIELLTIINKYNCIPINALSFQLSYYKYNKLQSEINDYIKENPHYTLKSISLLSIDIISQPETMIALKYKGDNKRLNKIDYKSDSKQKNRIAKLSDNLKNTLYPFQYKCIETSIRRNCRIIINDDMGLGKTIEAISLCSLYTEDWPLLIICPSSIKLYWKSQLIKYLKGSLPLIEHNIHLISSSKDLSNRQTQIKNDTTKSIYIISYELCCRNMDILLSNELYQEINFVICDESHYIKNKDSKRTKCLVPYIQKMKRVILMTGSYLKPVEMFSMLKTIRPDVFKSFRAYAERYCNPTKRMFGVDYSGYDNIEEFKYITNTFMIRRMKIDVMSELPSKHRQKIEIESDTSYHKQISLLVSKSTSISLQHQPISSISPFFASPLKVDITSPINCFAKAYYLSALSKQKSILDYVDYIISKKCKCVFFAYHQFILDLVEDNLKEQRAKYIRLDSTVLPNKRDELIQEYESNTECHIALLSLSSCYSGISLVSCSNIVFLEMHFNMSVMRQAEDRCYRIGQKCNCNVHYLYARGTVDDILYYKSGIGDTCQRKEIGEVGELNLTKNEKDSKGTLNSFLIQNVNIHESNLKREKEKALESFSLLDESNKESTKKQEDERLPKLK